MLLLVVFYLQKLWNLILVVTFRLYESNRFQMNVSPCDRKSVS